MMTLSLRHSYQALALITLLFCIGVTAHSQESEPNADEPSVLDPNTTATIDADLDLTPDLLPSTVPKAALTRADLDAMKAAREEEKKEYSPFSRQELGLTLPRASAMKVVRVTLDFNPQVLTQDQTVRGSAGFVQVQQGVFDTHVTGRIAPNLELNDRSITNRANPSQSPAPTPYPNPLRARRSVSEYELGVRKMLENGIIINPSVGFSHRADTDYGDFTNENQGTVNFAVTIPLARGGGTLSNKAPEIAARFDLLASTLQLRHITSQSVLAVLRAYWSCKAAEEIYKLRVESEAIATRLLGVGESLVEGDELAPAQLPQILADRDSTAAIRIQSEAELIASRQNLATTMGFAASSLLLAPLAKDEFPMPPEKEIFPQVQSLIDTALALRDDLRASRQTVKSKKVLMDASYLNLRPIINLELVASYLPLENRNSSTITTGNTWQGRAGFTLDWPVENNEAIGNVIQSQAAYETSQISVADTERQIVSEVITTLTGLRAAAMNVELYRESVRWNKSALDAQEQLFALGQGSLTDTITARQRFVDAQVSYVLARQNYANFLVQLRFATGTLFFADREGNWIDQNVWNIVPFAGGKKR